MPRDSYTDKRCDRREAASAVATESDIPSARRRPGAQGGPAGRHGTLAEPSDPSDPFPTVMRTRLSDQAYGRLFHKIVTGEFKEGDVLPSENDLCRSFQVSRPVVREALRRLRQDGLIASRIGLVRPAASVRERVECVRGREASDFVREPGVAQGDRAAGGRLR